MCTRDDCAGGLHGTSKNQKTCGDAEAAAREGGDEAADEEGPEEGQRMFPAAKRRFVRDKGHEMNKWLIGVCGLAAVLIVVLG